MFSTLSNFISLSPALGLLAQTAQGESGSSGTTGGDEEAGTDVDWHDQTEEADGDRTRQREGWPASDNS